MQEPKCGTVLEHFTDEEIKADKVIDWLDGMYGNHFMGKDTSDRAYRNRRDGWMKVTQEFSLDVIEAALKAIPEQTSQHGVPVYGEWPPNPVQFKALCKTQKNAIEERAKYAGRTIQDDSDWRYCSITGRLNLDLIFWRHAIKTEDVHYFYQNCRHEPTRSLIISELEETAS